MKREDLNFYLQHADLAEVQTISQRIRNMARVELIQQATPQTLMLPVSDPVNRGLFYGGEVLVTSVIVQVNGVNGWAMVMDEGEDLAFDLAVLDGGYAAGIEREEIEDLVGRARGNYAAEMAQIAADVAATRVSFDLM